MPITRLNHAVLFVRDANAAAEFYRSVEKGSSAAGLSVSQASSAAVDVRLEASTSPKPRPVGIW